MINEISNKFFSFLLLILILLILLIQTKKEQFTLSMGKYIRFLKEDKFDDNLSQGDLELINEIQDCYRNKNVYYRCINRLNLPYLRNPKKNKSFKKEIDYRKHRNVSHLLPYKPKFH